VCVPPLVIGEDAEEESAVGFGGERVRVAHGAGNDVELMAAESTRQTAPERGLEEFQSPNSDPEGVLGEERSIGKVRVSDSGELVHEAPVWILDRRDPISPRSGS